MIRKAKYIKNPNNCNEKTKTIDEWAKKYGVNIMDPDGFDRTDTKLYERYYTQAEFEVGLMLSTVVISDKDKFYKASDKSGLWGKVD
ncbi:MAG: hypothetical protein ACOCQR_02215 [bacterium]